MNFQVVKYFILISCLFGLLACSGSREVGQNEYVSTASQSTSLDTTSGLAGDGGISLGIGGKHTDKEEPSANGIGVNAYLWRATLDTLSFMPLASADPFGGVVITDWWEANTSSRERFKATAYIIGRSFRSNGVKVSVFRQIQRSGRWTDAQVATATSEEIENKILAHARELRTFLAGH